MRKQAVIVFILAILLMACVPGFFPTPIGLILENPRDYEGKMVKVSGVVTESINLFFVKGFKLKDDTGEIFVVTDKILPKVGSTTNARGYVKEGFTVGETQLIVIVEGEEK